MLGRAVPDLGAIVGELDAIKSKIKPTGAGLPLSAVKIEAPIPRPARNVFCVGKNYHEHAKEFARSGFDSSASSAADAIPTAPIVFTKAPECVIADGADIRYPEGVSDSVDYEAELGLVIGKGGRGIAKADAYGHIFGYTIVNDVTARDLQGKHKQWFLGKSLDRFCPMGPWLVTADEVDPENLGVRCWVNDELRQDANTRDLIFDIPTLIETISAGITLRPGRHHRHRHAGRRRHRLHAAEVPEARRPRDDRDRRAWAGCPTRWLSRPAPTGQPPSRPMSSLSRASRPSTTKDAAASERTSFSGTLRDSTSPNSTAGTLAIIMPNVVPAVTASRSLKRAESATVAIWVLSPISTRKKAIAVATNAPAAPATLGPSSALSGIRHQHRHGEEQDAQDPAHRVGAQPGGDGGAGPGGERVVGQGRDQDAQDDGNGPAIAGGENHGQELRLVPDLGDGNESC